MFCVPPPGVSNTARHRPVTGVWVSADANAMRIRQPTRNKPSDAFDPSTVVFDDPLKRWKGAFESQRR
jgi:hypothetical protein